MAKNRVDTSLTPELYCSNIKVSVAFYTETLGFSIQYEREEEGFAMLEREGSRIMLDEIGKPAASVNRSWLSASLEFPFGRGVNFQIKTAAVDKLYEKVQKIVRVSSCPSKTNGIERVILRLGNGNLLYWIQMDICFVL